jgi:hypothetical protein
MELGVDGTFKRRLKPDAAPNVPLGLASPDPEKKNGETPVVQHLHIKQSRVKWVEHNLRPDVGSKFHRPQ